jgi:spore coat polysaccharide biosynthesis predicted glycosyltransferase SpsG/CMP-N-acetylneuraminic acid synthetase
MKEFTVVIPAFKKHGVIPDQLIKKLDGKTLIQRAIDTGKELGESIYVVTDSQEISLIAERSGVSYIYDANFRIDKEHILQKFGEFLKELNGKYENLIIYRANTPLVDFQTILEAYRYFLENREKSIVSVKERDSMVFQKDSLGEYFRKYENSLQEINSFIIISSKNLFSENYTFQPYKISTERAIEIESYQDWWIAEKLLQRKKILFHVFGSTSLGMGHIYRALALAHEITNHEVLFVCHQKYELAVSKIASMDYNVISTGDVLETILQQKPDLVINDVLNTEESFIKSLKESGAKVVNFEDLGEGSKLADITVNELYEKPILNLNADNFLWGHNYYFLRDEFDDAKPHQFSEGVESVLISFGGGDRNNITLKSFNAVLPVAKENNIHINIVCGGGYLFKEELERAILESGYQNISLSFASGVISKIMERSQIAISSNGRTVYELADMNIPSIVVSQHDREATHSFSTLDRGFLNLGVVREGIENRIRDVFQKLVSDESYRELLFINIKKYGFRENKKRVVDIILKLI